MPSDQPFIHETESAIFTINNHQLSNPSKDPEAVVIAALDAGIGSVLCKSCNREYPVSQLQKEPVGHGSSPFNLKTSKKGGALKNLFTKKQKLPGMSGGVCFKCPKGHELIAVRTWMT